MGVLCLAGCGAAPESSTSSSVPGIVASAPANYTLELSSLQSNQRIELEPGRTYHLTATLVGQSLNNITLNGNGALILMGTPTVGFLELKNCSNITVANLTVDYDPLPFTQGTIQSVSGRTFEVTLQEGFPSLMEDYFVNAPQKNGLLRDRNSPLRLKAGAANVYPITGWTQSGNVFTLTTNGTSTAAMQPGDIYVQLARHDGSPAFMANTCSNVTYQGVTVNASPAAGFVALNSTRMVYRNNAIQPRDKRFHSTCADGIFQVQGAQGPIIEGNTISTNGDDGIIVKSVGVHEVGHQPDFKTFTLAPGLILHQGDRIEVYNPDSGVFLGSALIDTLVNNKITLDTAIPGVTPDCYFYNQNQCLSGFSVRGNTLISNRRWGIFCCSRNGVIAQNQIYNSNAQAIMLMNADQGMQDDGGVAPANVTIRDNSMVDCFLQTPGALSSIQGILSMATILRDAGRASNLADFRGNRQITVVNNTVQGASLPALSLQCADGLVVGDNLLQGNTVVVNNANNVTLTNTSAALQVNALNVTHFSLNP